MVSAADAYITYWQRQRYRWREWDQRFSQRARADLDRIVDLLVRQFGARRVILFGSLVKGRFGPGSDIDMAVEGISKGDFFAALAAANRLTPFRVDLKPLEDLEPHFLRRVLAGGECIYAADIG